MHGKSINVNMIVSAAEELKAGQRVFLSGTVYTARDAAHLRLLRMLDNGEKLPFSLDGAVIYYAGPTPTKPDGTIGSFGPTTSSRMDAFSPRLLDNGLKAMIGKGNRSPEVVEAIQRNKALYFCAGGGFGALISNSIISVEEIAFPELGCESIKKLVVKDFPLIVAIDSRGNSVFNR
ncbi:MAG: TRZ/ATZ family protein [Ruminococcaceae bacterium]|nr:TRZ/ATZ family protein [Oscillospiraceae bacterium]